MLEFAGTMGQLRDSKCDSMPCAQRHLIPEK
jgi:hypothetical protein